MVYLDDPQQFLTQSVLLVQARPSTTRITSRYRLAPARPSRRPAAGAGEAATGDAAAPRPRGYLVLKTYDPVSGACLQYRTTKAAEVGRLMGGLHRCARAMAAVPDEEPGTAEDDGGAAATAAAAAAPATATAEGQAPAQGAAGAQGSEKGAAQAGGGGGGGGGGKKKRKGKK